MSTSELPLFPLHTVLFPGIPLRLHIFEERYKQMIATCLQTHSPFGVILIRRGVEALGPLADPYPIGCLARIVEVQNLSEGRMNLTTIGQERFRILTLDRQRQPYLIGTIEPHPFYRSDMATLLAIETVLHPLVERYLALQAQASREVLDVARIPHDPLSLANLAASVVEVQPEEKQALLELDQAVDFLQNLVILYRREVALMTALVNRPATSHGPFSTN